MTVTINKMSAGKGDEYLLRTVAAGDGDRSLSTPLTRYYTETGTPPGRWLGSGVASLESVIQPGDDVTKEQLRLLIGQGTHPATGEPLGRRYRTYGQPEAGKRRHAVAGYDLTFSIPKSASVLWGVADGGTQALIAEAHHAAVVDALDFLEREVLATRVGAKGQLATNQRVRGRRPRSRLTVGLIPEAVGPMAPDMRRALDERRDLIEQRARTLAEAALRDNDQWVRALGPRPGDRALRAQWDNAADTVAAYRDRYGIEDKRLLGRRPQAVDQRLDFARALAAIRRMETATPPVAGMHLGREIQL